MEVLGTAAPEVRTPVSFPIPYRSASSGARIREKDGSHAAEFGHIHSPGRSASTSQPAAPEPTVAVKTTVPSGAITENRSESAAPVRSSAEGRGLLLKPPACPETGTTTGRGKGGTTGLLVDWMGNRDVTSGFGWGRVRCVVGARRRPLFGWVKPIKSRVLAAICAWAAPPLPRALTSKAADRRLGLLRYRSGSQGMSSRMLPQGNQV